MVNKVMQKMSGVVTRGFDPLSQMWMILKQAACMVMIMSMAEANMQRMRESMEGINVMPQASETMAMAVAVAMAVTRSPMAIA